MTTYRRPRVTALVSVCRPTPTPPVSGGSFTVAWIAAQGGQAA